MTHIKDRFFGTNILWQNAELLFPEPKEPILITTINPKTGAVAISTGYAEWTKHGHTSKDVFAYSPFDISGDVQWSIDGVEEDTNVEQSEFETVIAWSYLAEIYSSFKNFIIKSSRFDSNVFTECTNPKKPYPDKNLRNIDCAMSVLGVSDELTATIIVSQPNGSGDRSTWVVSTIDEENKYDATMHVRAVLDMAEDRLYKSSEEEITSPFNFTNQKGDA